jgi:hypothetical protein
MFPHQEDYGRLNAHCHDDDFSRFAPRHQPLQDLSQMINLAMDDN